MFLTNSIVLPRARSAGYIPTKDGGRDRVYLPIGSIKEWSNIEDVEIVVRPHHAWIVNILPLSSVDEKKGVAKTSTDATYVMNQLHLLKKMKLNLSG